MKPPRVGAAGGQWCGDTRRGDTRRGDTRRGGHTAWGQTARGQTARGQTAQQSVLEPRGAARCTGAARAAATGPAGPRALRHRVLPVAAGACPAAPVLPGKQEMTREVLKKTK